MTIDDDIRDLLLGDYEEPSQEKLDAIWQQVKERIEEPMNHEMTIATLREMGELMPRTSPHERMVLLVIFAADEPVQMGHVAKRAGITAGAMTTITDRLIAAGLIERVRDLGDRRYVHVKATAKGKKLVARAEKKATEVVAA